jgi:electron transport complex protein RnfC
MMRRSFLGLTTPRFQYDTLIGKLPAPVNIATPEQATFLIEGQPGRLNNVMLQKGDSVKTGQKISLADPFGAYAISSVTGRVASIEPFPAESGRNYTAVSIEVSNADVQDVSFESLCDRPTREIAESYLSFLPGDLSFKALNDSGKPIHTLVINAVDRDLLVVTARYAIAARLHDLKNGIGILKSITGIDNIVLAVPRDTLQGHGEIGASAISIDTTYPYGHPYFIARRLVGHDFPVNQKFQELGLFFLSAEAVISLGRSFADKKIAVTKLMTFVDKDGNRSLVSAKIGTPIGDIFKTFHLSLHDQDRIIIGGPMRGHTVFSESYPVQPGTDAIMVQDRSDIALVSDYPCINCGECIRVCPARIQVNLLVRFLEAGRYEDAADNYDLFSCLDCGLCSFVCVSRIPIFQFITLAKYELGKMNAEETRND